MTTHSNPARHDWRSIAALAEIVNAGAKKTTLSEHALRHYVRHANTNGLGPHVRKLGRKILISESGFYDWLSRAPSDD
ncbi:hypothetical protein ThidrDRAFT_1100 [Thiorhodococcus drewsii AZ1]|uniref:DNA-binding protein n=1 Tax=Thiorhodococcus drewsii AZ1 TaxID=765913 RepID=G2DYI8_9GAMM|nr:hypothetical protein [Thiorhodococcus drewsii]EGV32615.1 hypothetical protein ThidrDRAFT_1100 [Thiorhodococcus drewsii AZ1]